MFLKWSLCTAASLHLALSGCATFSPDHGFGRVQQAAQTQLGKSLSWARTEADRNAIRQRVAQLLARPLLAEDAVQVALLNNQGLQASFDELGIAEADRVQAGRLPNPGFSFGRLQQGAGLEAGREINRSISFNLVRLLMLPVVNQMEAQRFEQTRLAVCADVLALAAETREAHTLAVAANETVHYMQQVQTAAEAGAELAHQLLKAGNRSALQHMREQSFLTDAAVNLSRAKQAQVTTRERLTRLMGLQGQGHEPFQLPERLPDLPKTTTDQHQIEQTAMTQRLDVQAAKLEAAQLAQNLGLTRTTRFINVLELGATRNSFNNAPPQRGYELHVELPLFDWGDARVAKAEATYRQALNRTAQIAINARSQVREAYASYRSSHDLARLFRDEIVPLKKRMSAQNLLRYNGMLIGVFELLADARSQIMSVNAHIEALRDFWLAQARLDHALMGAPVGLNRTKAPLPTPTTGSDTAH